MARYASKGRERYVEGWRGSRLREVKGHRIKQADLVVENFRLLGRPLASARDTGQEPAVEGAAQAVPRGSGGRGIGHSGSLGSLATRRAEPSASWCSGCAPGAASPLRRTSAWPWQTGAPRR